MTTPPAPAEPPAPTPPPAPAAPPAANGAAPPAGYTPSAAELATALAEERRARKASDDALAELRKASMTDHELALATAREEGRAEASRAASVKLAGAEFRLQATGRLANPDAALAALDLSKLLDKHGDPDVKAIGELVASLAVTTPPTPAPVHVPAGPRMPIAGGTGSADWLRSVQRPGRRRG